MINKEEAKQLVQWGIDNGLVIKGSSSGYAVSTIKRMFYTKKDKEQEREEMVKKLYEDVLRQIKNDTFRK